MKLKINIEQYGLIKKMFDIPNNKITNLLDIKDEKEALSYFNDIKNKIHLSHNFIEGDIEVLSELREISANYLMILNSFDKNDNPTKIGIIIESLIDLFNV